MTNRKNRQMIYIGVLTIALLLALSSIAMAAVRTDQPDYSPGSVVTISGGNSDGAPGYNSGSPVNVAIVGPHDPAYESTTCDSVAVNADGNWSCTVTLWADPAWAVGTYTYTATSTTVGGSLISDPGIFTDDAQFKIKFATIGLPSGVSVAVTWSGISNGGHLKDQTATFTSPSPSGNIIVDPTSEFSFSFPTPLLSGSYVLLSVDQTSPFTTGDSGASKTITATYGPTCTAPTINIGGNPSNQAVTYGINASFSASASGNPTPSVKWQVNTGLGWSDIPDATSGTYSISTPTIAMNGNQYRAVFTNTCGSVNTSAATLTVNKAAVKATAGSYDATYDGSAHPTGACVLTAIAPNTYTGDLSCTNNPVSVGPNVGSGNVDPVVSGTGLANFDITSVNGSWSISKAPVTMTAGSYSGTYDGNSHDISACTVTPNDPNTYKGALACTNDPDSVKDAGSGSVTPVLVLNNETATNFAVTSMDGSWSIDPAPVTITAGSYIGTYDGSAHSPSLCAVTGDYTGALTCTNDPVSVKDAGSGAVAPVLALNLETASNFAVTPVNGSWLINPAPVTMTAGDYSGTYDGGSHSPSGCAVTGAYIGTLTCTNDPASVKDAGSGAVAPVLVLNLETASNFAVTPVNGSWSINPAPVTMTAGSYSGTYDGNSHDISACIVSGIYKGALTCTNSPVSVGPNVGSGSVGPLLVLNGETASNFTITPANGSYNITPAPVRMYAGGYTGIYDGTSHPTSACVVMAIFPNTYKGALACTNDPDSVKDAGSGVVAPVLVLNLETASNFAVTPVNGSWSINPAPVTMTAGSYSGTYDGNSHDISACVVSGIYKGALTCTNSPASVGPNVGSGSAGPLLVLNGETASNFTITPVNGSYVITPAPLTIKAKDQSKVLGATFTLAGTEFTTNGLVSPDSVTSVTLTSAGSPSTAAVGTYPIVPSAANGSGLSNYTITYTNGTLSVLYSTGDCYGGPGHSILQPINSDGTSVFKKGSTVPAKFRVCDAFGNSIGTPGVVISFRLVQTISGTVISAVNEPVDATTPDTTFRWSADGQQWIFNINTKNLTANTTYYYDITLNDGSHILFNFGLK